MIFKNSQLYVIAIAVMLAVGCKKEDDTGANKQPEPIPSDKVKPQVSFKSFPAGFKIVSGESFNIEGEVTDDEELERFVISIDYMDKTSVLPFAPFFYWDTTVMASGKKASFNYTIGLPDDIASGLYTVTINVKDKTGNAENYSDKSIFIKNHQDSIKPFVKSTLNPSPDANKVINVSALDNNRINYSFETYDSETGVRGLNVQLVNLSNDSTYFETTTQLNGKSSDYVSETVNFLSNWPKGDYSLKFNLYDLKNNSLLMNYKVVWN